MTIKNSKITKGFIVALVLLIVLSSVSTVFAIQRFTDVPEGHWAKEYINKMHNLGIITGDEDFATFKPDEKVGELDGIVMISKLLEVNVELASKAIEANKDFLEEMKISNEQKKDVAVALSAGIVSKDTLKKILNDNTSEYINKVDVCIFLTRAMNLEEEANKKEFIFLPFTDAEFIPAKQASYIDMMIDKGIISKKGDSSGNFNPEAPVTRAVMAKMLSFAYDYIQENKVKIIIDEDDGQVNNNEDTNEDKDDNEENDSSNSSNDQQNEQDQEEENIKLLNITGTITGTLKTKNTINIKILTDDGDETLYQANSEAKATLDGEKISIMDMTEGAVVEAEITEDNEILSLEATSFEDQYSGRVVSIANVLVPFITIEFDKGNKTEEMYFYGTEEMTVILDGEEAKFGDLEKGDSVDLKTKEDEVVKIIAESKNREFNGTLLKVDFDEKPLIVIQDYNDEVKEFKLDNETQIVRNGKEIHFIDLKSGDNIKIITEYDKIKKVEAEVVRTEVSGILSSILIANTSKLTITNDSGKETTYIITNESNIKVEGTYKAIYDLRLGHKVNMELEGNVIVNLTAEKVEQESRYIGDLIYINTDSQVIMIKAEDGQNKMINTTAQTSFMDVDGKKRTMDYLEIGDELLVVCTHDGVTFIAKNIVIMPKDEN